MTPRVAVCRIHPPAGRHAGRHRSGRVWRLGVSGDQAVAWVDELRVELPDAFADAVTSLPATVRSEGERMADRIVAHIRGTWRPE